METTTHGGDGAGKGPYNVVLSSIGTGGAAVIGALKQVFPLPEQALAARLFQTPSLLLQNLSQELAERASQALRQAGLESEVRHQDEPFAPGDAEHEVALVVRDFSRMTEVLQSVCALLGVGPQKGRDILCTSPTVLIGRISKSTVAALERRFAPLGVELDVAQPLQSRFDAFLGDASPAERARAVAILTALGHAVPAGDAGDRGQPLLAASLPFSDAQKLWEQASRGARLPITLLNQAFARFDLRLDQAPATPELVDFLVRTAGMPERVVPKVLGRLPIVTHGNIRLADLCRHMETIAGLGGQASGHLLCFQSFALAIDKVGDAAAAQSLLAILGRLSPEAAAAALAQRSVPGPLTAPQARWLQHELKSAGTLSRLVLR